MSTRGYFDYNATTPVCREAIETFHAAIDDFGNPSSRYGLAKAPLVRLREAREQVARLIGAQPEDLFFTSGGTEANNWAIKGALTASGALGRAAGPAHVVVSEIEHASVLEVAVYLERVFGFEVTRLAPDGEGRITLESVLQSLRPHTRLVSVMLVNNEVGTVQPVGAIAQALRERGIHFHVDAVQAVGKVQVDVAALGVDSLSLAGHKFYGPKGVGALYVRAGAKVEPLIHGGGQERGQRGGTEATAAIAAMGAAAQATHAELPALLDRLAAYQAQLRAMLAARVPGIAFNGPPHAQEQAPNTLSIRVNGIRAEALAAMLDHLHGIQVSLGSACSNNKSVSLSHVLRGMGLGEEQIKATMRVSIGRYTEQADLERFVEAVANGVALLQRIANPQTEKPHALAS